MRRYPSGQRGLTVNQMAHAFGGSNPSLRTGKEFASIFAFWEKNFLIICYGINKDMDTQDVQKNLSYAGFWERFAAFIIDWFITLAGFFIIGLVYGFSTGTKKALRELF